MIYHEMGLPEKAKTFFARIPVELQVSRDVLRVFSQSFHKLLYAGFGLACMQCQKFQNQP